MRMTLSSALAATVLAFALGGAAFAQGKGAPPNKGDLYKGGNQDRFTVAEPSTLALLGLGLVGVALFARGRKK